MPRKIVRRRPARRPRRAKMFRKRMMKRTKRSTTQNYAVSTEGVENKLTLNANGEYAFNYTTSLSEFQRSQEIAHAYKYYRCKSIELQFVPYANFSSVNGPVNSRLPQLYFTLDRVCNQWIIPTEAEMIERGVSPRLFKKKMVFRWRPNLLQTVQLETNQPTDGQGVGLGIDVVNATNSIPVFNKWLPTQQSYGFTNQPPNQQINQQMVQPSVNPYALRYYGAIFVINQEDGTEETAIGDLITKVTWEFKSPRALATNPPDPQVVVSPGTSMTTPGVVANTQPTAYP